MTAPAQRTSGWVVGRAALVGGVLGAVVGLVRGLTVYAPTAWAAALEVGVPAAAAGGIVGLAIAGVRAVARRIQARSEDPAIGRDA